VPLPWLTPVANEPIEDYAGRMRTGIQGDRPVLLGVSFGGMMAIEIAKHLPGARVIIISSIRDRYQLPLWIRMGGRIYPRWLNPQMKHPRRWMAFAEDYFIGVESAEDRRLVTEFQNKVDREFLYWSIHAIARWRNEWTPNSFYHIHGGKDRMFPLRKVAPMEIVPDGNHLMVFNRAEAISRMLHPLIVP